jgi:hypothetical protein
MTVANITTIIILECSTKTPAPWTFDLFSKLDNPVLIFVKHLPII